MTTANSGAASSMRIMRLTSDAFAALQALAREHPEVWIAPETDFDAIFKSVNLPNYAEPAKFWAKDKAKHEELYTNDNIILDSAERLSRNAKARADKQALAFTDNIPGLTPELIADPRLLAWLSCFHLHEFGIGRWPTIQGSDLTRHILQHYLPESGRPITDASVAGRMFWLAEISRRAASASGGAFTAEETLMHFSQEPEHYHNCTSYLIMRSNIVLAEYVRALLTDEKGINRQGAREIARALNREAGARLIDALDRKELRSIIHRSVETIMSDPNNVRDRSKVRNRKIVRVLSLGAGVQSTVMALMAERGYLGMERPDLAIFADTGWEPKAVYEHLEWLKTQLSYEVKTVSAGNIREDILSGQNPEGRQFIDIPVFIVKDDGKKYVGTRQCTKQYKVRPIQRELRKRYNLKPGQLAPKDIQIEMWLGITTDEATRQKPSREQWITNRWPLIEMDLSRAQLYQWFMENYPGRPLPKSACIGCPYHSDRVWKQMKEHDPESFKDAVYLDWAIRNVERSKGALTGVAYLHSSRKPLNEVNFNDSLTENDAMQQECEGLCGV